MSKQLDKFNNHLVNDIRQIIQQARVQVYHAVNSAMVQAYWHIGRLIVEDEQKGEKRASYGKQQLENLARDLTVEFGKGFDGIPFKKEGWLFKQY